MASPGVNEGARSPSSPVTQPPARSSSKDSLKLRLISSAIGLPVLVLAVWAGNPWTVLAAVVVGALALREFLALGPDPHIPALRWTAYGWGVAVIATTAITSTLVPDAYVAGLLVSLTVLVLLRRRDAAPSWAWAATGVAYTCVLVAFAPMLRSVAHGGGWLLLALLVTFAADTGAYFTGKLIGRHKMAPAISPAKTWEGFVGGLALSIAAAVVLGPWLEVPLGELGLAALGAVVAMAGAIGDLAESLLKRSAGVKEAGALVPGHGGMLDRLDSVLFTLPLVYYVATVVLH